MGKISEEAVLEYVKKLKETLDINMGIPPRYFGDIGSVYKDPSPHAIIKGHSINVTLSKMI